MKTLFILPFLLIPLFSPAQDSLFKNTGRTFPTSDTSKVLMLVSKKVFFNPNESFAITSGSEVFCTSYGVSFAMKGYRVHSLEYGHYLDLYLDGDKKPITDLIIWISIDQQKKAD